jgi:hypothetical protein
MLEGMTYPTLGYPEGTSRYFHLISTMIWQILCFKYSMWMFIVQWIMIHSLLRNLKYACVNFIFLLLQLVIYIYVYNTLGIPKYLVSKSGVPIPVPKFPCNWGHNSIIIGILPRAIWELKVHRENNVVTVVVSLSDARFVADQGFNKSLRVCASTNASSHHMLCH